MQIHEQTSKTKLNKRGQQCIRSSCITKIPKTKKQKLTCINLYKQPKCKSRMTKRLKNARNGEKESKLNENYCTRTGLRHKTIKMILFKWYSGYKIIQKSNPISF